MNTTAAQIGGLAVLDFFGGRPVPRVGLRPSLHACVCFFLRCLPKGLGLSEDGVKMFAR